MLLRERRGLNLYRRSSSQLGFVTTTGCWNSIWHPLSPLALDDDCTTVRDLRLSRHRLHLLSLLAVGSSLVPCSPLSPSQPHLHPHSHPLCSQSESSFLPVSLTTPVVRLLLLLLLVLLLFFFFFFSNFFPRFLLYRSTLEQLKARLGQHDIYRILAFTPIYSRASANKPSTPAALLHAVSPTLRHRYL